MIKMALANSVKNACINKLAINLKMPKMQNPFAHKAPEGKMLGRLDDYLAMNPKAFDPSKQIPERFGRLADRVQAKGHKDTAEWLRTKKQQAEAMSWEDPRVKSRQAQSEIFNSIKSDAGNLVKKIAPSTATKSLYLRAGSKAVPAFAALNNLDDLRTMAASNPTLMGSLDTLFRGIFN